MKREFSDELISAFLDDELNVDERKQVEQLLVDSAEHRQMFNELKALRGSLQNLPSYKLDGDFADRVVRLAEQAMASDSDVNSEPMPVSSGSWRTAVIIISAVAAMLLISVVSLPQSWDFNGEPAVALTGDDDVERKSTADEVSIQAPDQTMEFANAAPAGKTVTRDSFSDIAAGGGDAGALPSEDNAVSANRSDAKNIARSRAKPNGSLSKSAQKGGLGGGGKEVAGPFAPAASFSAPMPKQASPTTEPADTVAKNESDKKDAAFEAPQPEGSSELKYQSKADDQYVVLVDFTKQAFEKRALDLALRKNGINLLPTLGNHVEPASANADAPLDLTVRANKPQPANDPAEWSKAQQSVDVVIVEALASQIEATFDDLDSSGYLLAMNVHNEGAADSLVQFSAQSRESAQRFQAADGRQLFEKLMRRKIAASATEAQGRTVKEGENAGGASLNAPSAPGALKRSASSVAAKDEEGDDLAKKLGRDSQGSGAGARPKAQDSENGRRKLLQQDEKSTNGVDRSVDKVAKGDELEERGVAVRVVPPVARDFRRFSDDFEKYSGVKLRSETADQVRTKGTNSENAKSDADEAEELAEKKSVTAATVVEEQRAMFYRQQPGEHNSKVRVVFVIRAVEPAIAGTSAEAETAP